MPTPARRLERHRGQISPARHFFDRFAKQAERAPDATAVSASRVRLSYRELARRSSVIADRLAENGVGRDVIVILLAERGVDLLAGMIAVQRAGGAFLPLDPALPAARLAQIIAHSGTRLILAGPGSATLLEAAVGDIPTRVRPQILSLPELIQAAPRTRKPSPTVRPAPASLGLRDLHVGLHGVPRAPWSSNGACSITSFPRFLSSAYRPRT